MTGIAFHHIALTCRDPIAVERWYTRHFGFRRARVVSLDDGQIVFLKGPGLYLELFQATAERPVPPPQNDGNPWPGVRNISFAVADVDAKLAEMGGDATVVFGPVSFEAFIPGWRSVWLRDPGGDLVQLTQGFTDQHPPPPD